MSGWESIALQVVGAIAGGALGYWWGVARRRREAEEQAKADIQKLDEIP